MSDHYNVNYSGLESGSTTASNYDKKISDAEDAIKAAKTILNNQSIFMGPVQEKCIEEIDNSSSDIEAMKGLANGAASFLTRSLQNYKDGDQKASSAVISSASKKLSGGGNRIDIPTSVKQAGYTVTCYGEGGWYLGGGSTPTAVASGTNQKLVHNAWLADGARYKNGIAVMNVDGTDHYLIATAPTLGKVGDSVDVNLDNGQTVPCVIADAKSTHDSNYTTFGHGRSDGSVNVLEFEVDRNAYNSKGNPSTSSWGLEWDSSSDVRSVDNYGSIV